MLKSALATAALALAVFVTLGTQNPPNTAKNAQVTLRWLGTAGWEISDGKTFILIDPYISRIFGPQPPGRTPFERTPGDSRPHYGLDDLATPDVAAVDARVPRADYVLVTHTHFDPVMDVPRISLKTHATVIGTESTANVLRAYSVPEEQLITVRGGEDYEFGAFSLKVIPSLHSPLSGKHYFSSETVPKGLKAPLTLRQMLVEGGTLAYLVRLHGHQILAFGGMNYIEREMQGLKPDVVLVGAAGSHRELYDYCGRLMRALQVPALVLPTHWDNFTAPYEASQQTSIDALQSFLEEMKAASPKTKVIVPKYFEPIPLEPAEK